MITLVFAMLILFLGLHALISGSFQLNHYLILKGVWARIAGLILMSPFPVWLFFVGFSEADWQSAARALLGCSALSVIGVMVFAALQAVVAKLGRKEGLLKSDNGKTKATAKIVSRHEKSRNVHHFTRLYPKRRSQ